MAALLCSLASGPSGAQLRYHNIINQRFRTIGNGPQSALIVDVGDTKDPATVRSAVEQSYQQMRHAQDPILLKELAAMRRSREVKPGRQLDVVDVALVRHSGKLALPPVSRGVTRAAPNQLTFNFPTSGADAWTTAKAQQLVGLTNALITELTKVLGPPAWNGTVNVLNKDPYLGTVNEILGALFVLDSTTTPATYEIWFPTFSDAQTEFLAMAQAMAQAWHGPALIGYDAWEKGMARAVAVIAASDLQTYPGTTTAIDPANGFYYTPDYDLLNQPPLGNNTFTPPTKGAEPGPTVNPTQYGGMIIPRLQMSGSAWLKCWIENPSFFQQFNTAYYTAFNADPTAANDVNRLRGYAAAADPSVEGQPFDAWYEQQFVLDTSVTVGIKLYAHVFATFPDSTTGAPAGAGIYLIYYQTSTTGDETDQSGTCQVVYWDYTFSNRLTLPGFMSVTIADGFGSVAPYFQGIGGTPPDTMRVAMDFPVGKEYVRVYFPAGQTGTATAPNDFAGVVVGQNSGTVSAVFNSGGSIATVNTTVTNGDFGGISSTIGAGFSRTKLTLSLAGTPTVNFQRNVYIRPGDISPTFQLVAPGPTTTLNNTFNPGLQMISLPIRPLTSDLATVIGVPVNQLPMTLMAQYREDNTIGSDQYLRYPTLPLYEPGYGLWIDLPSVTTNPNGIVGLETDATTQPNVSIALQYGWNQIGTPYPVVNLDITKDIQFQYLGGDPAPYADAISNGWIATGITAYSQTNGYELIDTSTDANVPQNQLVPWNGYWIRVTVPEGVTLTYIPPGGQTAQIKSAAKRAASKPVKTEPGSWQLPFHLSDTKGHSSTAALGQSASGSDNFIASLDVDSPPTIPNINPLTLRFPAKQGDAATKGTPGDLITDIRRSNTKSTWDLAVTMPAGQMQYTLTWGNVALLPHGMRLTLLDKSTGALQTINSTSSYTFQVGKNETTRQFQVIAQPRSIGSLAIMNVNAVAPKSVRGLAPAAMTISYELSAAAQTSAVIQLNGRTVRHLAQNGRATDSGVTQLVWDYKDDSGRALAGGTYTLQITAQTSEGERTRSIVPITVVR